MADVCLVPVLSADTDSGLQVNFVHNSGMTGYK